MFNETIFQTYRNQAWSIVHQAWKEGFIQFLELSGKISEKELYEIGKYMWLREYPLSAVLLGSYEHHQEHFEGLQN